MKHTRWSVVALSLLVAGFGGDERKSRPGTPGGPGGTEEIVVRLTARVPPPLSDLELWVSGFTSGAVHRYNPRFGDPRGTIAPIPGAQSINLGPDGFYYVCRESANEVVRVKRGEIFDVFVGDDLMTPQDETGGLTNPTAAVFGPDGNLYVASFDGDQVLRYDGTNGTYLGVFVAPASGGLNGPDAGMLFAPDGMLWVPGFFSDAIHRYDGTTGAFVDNLTAPLLRRPRVLRFLDGGGFLVSAWSNNAILRFDPSGVFDSTFATFNRPTGMAISPLDGDLYVTSDASSRVVRFDIPTGANLGAFVPSGGGGLNAGTYLEFVRDL